MRPNFVLIVFACSLPVTGCMAAEPSPATRPATQPATQPAAITLVRLEPRTNDAGAIFHLIYLRFTNSSDRPLHFQDYGSTPFLSRMTLRDGRVVEERQPHIRGGIQEPLSREDLERKFLGNVRFGGLDDARAHQLLNQLSNVLDGPLDLAVLRG